MRIGLLVLPSGLLLLVPQVQQTWLGDIPGFIAKAPEEVVEENRRRLDEEQKRRAALEAALSRLG